MTEPEEEPGGEGRSPSVTPRCCGGAMRAGRCGTRRLRAQGAGRTAPPCLASQRLADGQHFGGRLRHRRAPPPGQSQRCEAEVTSYPHPMRRKWCLTALGVVRRRFLLIVGGCAGSTASALLGSCRSFPRGLPPAASLPKRARRLLGRALGCPCFCTVRFSGVSWRSRVVCVLLQV